MSGSWKAHFEKYYTSFYPSRKRLFEKVDAKIADPRKAKEVKASLESFIIEDVVVTEKVRSLLLRGKSHRYILTNLIQKGFEKDHILGALSSSAPQDQRQALESIQSKILVWIHSGKSYAQIAQKLFEYHEHKSELMLFLEQNYTQDTQEEIVLEHIHQLRNLGVSDEKILSRLLGRGFSIGIVRRLLRDL